jgi:glycosyltransferase involved in cell wall biosynthesis
MNKKPFFSIIMTSYNHGNFISEAINSILFQSCQDWQLIIVDDFSTDNSWDIIQSFSDSRITSHRFNENKGAAEAYNFAASLCCGEYIASLDSDDQYHPDKLLAQRILFEGNEDIKICSTWVSQINESGSSSEVEEWFNVSIDLNDPRSWIGKNRICHSSVAICSSIFKDIGYANKNLIYTPDWEMWIKALVLEKKFFQIEEKLTYYRQHANNITHRSRLSTKSEWANISRKYLHPYLWKKGRFDLIALNLKEFSNLLFVKDSFEQSKLKPVDTIFLEALGYCFDESQELSLDIVDIRNTAYALIQVIDLKCASLDLVRQKIDSTLSERDTAIAERDAAIAERDAAIAERDVVPRIAHLFFLNLRRLTSYFKKT